MRSIIKNILFLFLLIQSASCLAEDNQSSQLAPVVTVVNQQLNQDSISQHGLNAIFKMRLHKWKDNTPVTLFVLADNDSLHKSFCKTILNVFPYQMRRSWDRLVFSGSGQAPIQLDSKEEMIKKVSSIVGAIGYLRISDIQEGIKILQIQSRQNN